MPNQWNNIWVCTVEELVPTHFNQYDSLKKAVQRYKDKTYGIKKVQTGGNGRQMLISFDSLPQHIKDVIGDPRKGRHPLEEYFRYDGDALNFYRDYRFEDGTALSMGYQERYSLNASMIKALFGLKFGRYSERVTKGGSIKGIMATLHQDAISFQLTLKKKYNKEHSLPENYKRFKDCLNGFEKEGFESLISKKHKNANAQKVTDKTIHLLNCMFAKQQYKPTATEIHRQYSAFINGWLEVINSNTGELYNPKEYKALSESTIKAYLGQWGNRIGNHGARSGDRQKYMGQFKPYHSLDRPKYAGSIISVDDRQPPFKSTEGKRVWFYNGIDLASEAFVCAVHGKDKEGIIVEFYRQLVRNYHHWGLPLPHEIECEMSLNSSFTETFLKPGAMFQEVRIEANNARGKRIERYYGALRYEIEKEREGWLARPHALKESNQQGALKVAELPFEVIVNNGYDDIERWNNTAHSLYPGKTRWEVFMETQNPELKPTNYQSILPYIGFTSRTSCKAGIIKFQGKEWLLGDHGKMATGEGLIRLMEAVEGEEITVYWIDNEEGIFKAIIFQEDQFICEAIAKPTYNRAKIERTEQDEANRELMSAYVASIEAFGRRQKSKLEPVTLIDRREKEEGKFKMPGRPSRRLNVDTETGEILPEVEEILVPQETKRGTLLDRY